MSTIGNIMAGGLPAETAKAIVGTTGTLTGAGTVTGDAATIVTQNVAASGASNSGIKLPASNAGDKYYIGIVGANTVLLYPPTGGKLNGGSADASESMATTISAVVVFYTNIDAIVILGA